MTMVISQLGLKPDTLHGETVIVTGAGGGIGYEAARALLGLGANVVIAEINHQNGRKAEYALEGEFGKDRVLFVQTDVGEEPSVKNLYNLSNMAFGKVDAVINNATVAVLGQVKDLAIEEWDKSYHVNLRGPVLMAKTFLPDMIQRDHGTFACVSSTGTAFLGGYETFKAAQVHLANTLDAELEGTNVIAYTIGPGLVPTETASKAVAQLAPQMGMSVEAFFEMNKGAVLSVEEAGAGFAASIVFAEKFRGQEISSIQALKAANINFGARPTENNSAGISLENRKQAQALCEKRNRWAGRVAPCSNVNGSSVISKRQPVCQWKNGCPPLNSWRKTCSAREPFSIRPLKNWQAIMSISRTWRRVMKGTLQSWRKICTMCMAGGMR